MTAFRPAIWLAAIGSLSLAGCQRANSLQGMVTYNGEPVEKGSIAFRPADGTGPGFGAQIVDGKYSAAKVHLGKHIALLRGVHAKVAPQSTEDAIRQFEAAKAAGKKTLDHFGQQADYIPDDADGNGATIEIEGGRQSLDFSLKGPPRSG